MFQQLPEPPIVQQQVLLVFLVHSIQLFLCVNFAEERIDEKVSKHIQGMLQILGLDQKVKVSFLRKGICIVIAAMSR